MAQVVSAWRIHMVPCASQVSTSEAATQARALLHGVPTAGIIPGKRRHAGQAGKGSLQRGPGQHRAFQSGGHQPLVNECEACHGIRFCASLISAVLRCVSAGPLHHHPPRFARNSREATSYFWVHAGRPVHASKLARLFSGRNCGPED